MQSHRPRRANLPSPALCEARRSTGAEADPFAGADAEDGAACLDAALAGIDAARFLDPEVRAALTDCARRCTPDLAFGPVSPEKHVTHPTPPPRSNSVNNGL